MKQPRWQKARILVGPHRGEHIWIGTGGHGMTDREGNYCRITNIRKTTRGLRVYVVLQDVELMAVFKNIVPERVWRTTPKHNTKIRHTEIRAIL